MGLDSLTKRTPQRVFDEGLTVEMAFENTGDSGEKDVHYYFGKSMTGEATLHIDVDHTSITWTRFYPLRFVKSDVSGKRFGSIMHIRTIEGLVELDVVDSLYTIRHQGTDNLSISRRAQLAAMDVLGRSLGVEEYLRRCYTYCREKSINLLPRYML
mgnify:CR=1 FL=1|tara:strand:- start:78057 stop:78524 length:468 start_codon:yes stop_codon:yes gene_type:complete